MANGLLQLKCLIPLHILGPQRDTSRCLGNMTSDCGIIQDSWPAGLVLDSVNNQLVMCHTLHHGECLTVALDTFTFTRISAPYISIDTTRLVPEYFPRLYTHRSSGNKNVLYVANSLVPTVVNALPEPHSVSYNERLTIISAYTLPQLQALTFDLPKHTASRIMPLDVYKDNIPQPISALLIFSYMDNVYFLGSDLNLARVCSSFPTKNSLVMTQLEVDELEIQGPGDVHAHVGKASIDVLPIDSKKKIMDLNLHDI